MYAMDEIEKHDNEQNWMRLGDFESVQISCWAIASWDAVTNEEAVTSILAKKFSFESKKENPNFPRKKL